MPSIWISVEIPEESLDDIFYGALGHGYSWFPEYEEVEGGWLLKHDPVGLGNEEDFEDLFLSRTTLAHAVGKWLERQFSFEDYDSALDSMDADCVIQTALFGSVLFA